jgi:predicted ArsR family transcriptional regulator
MSDEEILKHLREHPDPAVTAAELAELVDMTSAGVLRRLDNLADENEVSRKKVGSRAVVWWISGS